jgi:gliding motility-associated-like protein
MKNKITNIALVVLLFISGGVFAQINLDQQVIGSTGGFHQVPGGNSYSYTVGETVVKPETIFSLGFIFTQGFQQSGLFQSVVTESATYQVINESCASAANGSIFIESVTGFEAPFNVVVKTTTIDSTVVGAAALSSGTYHVIITDGNGAVFSTQITVGLDSNEDCDLKFYSGITPNGDGNNDSWQIDNIESFPENTVQIFNRWGNEVWSGKGYNNNEVVWEGLDKAGVQLSDATYFYVVTIGDKVTRSWVELTR